MLWFRHRDRIGTDSQEALRDAEQNLKIVQERGPEVSQIAGSLKNIRERNHFREALQEIITGHGGNLNATRR